MMKRLNLFRAFRHLLPLLSCLALLSCDDGNIVETYIHSAEGRSVHLTATLTGHQSWASGYELALAGFSEESDYAAILLVVRPDADGIVDITMEGIPEEVTSVELCAVNTLRQRVATFAKIDGDALRTKYTIDFAVGTLHASMFAAIQRSVFNTTCVGCHRATESAAGLPLTDGSAYEALVGKPSKKDAALLLVEPGNAAASMLYRALTTDVSSTWRYDHTAELTSDRTKHFICDWMNAGACE